LAQVAQRRLCVCVSDGFGMPSTSHRQMIEMQAHLPPLAGFHSLASRRPGLIIKKGLSRTCKREAGVAIPCWDDLADLLSTSTREGDSSTKSGRSDGEEATHRRTLIESRVFPSLVPIGLDCDTCSFDRSCECIVDMDSFDLSTEVSTDAMDVCADVSTDESTDVPTETDMYFLGVRIQQGKATTAEPIVLKYSGCPEAIYNLGMMYKQGAVFEQDKAKAVELFEIAHAAGHVKAAYNVGLMYQRGEGVGQDCAKAAKFYQQAHEKGYAKATYNLGKLHARGRGVQQDSVKAAGLFQQVAELAGDAEGRFASRTSLRTYLKKSHIFTIDVVHRSD